MKKSLLFSLIFLAGFSPAFGMKQKKDLIVSFNVLAREILPFLTIHNDEKLFDCFRNYVESEKPKFKKCRDCKKNETECSLCKKIRDGRFRRFHGRFLGKALKISTQIRPLCVVVRSDEVLNDIGSTPISYVTKRMLLENYDKVIEWGVNIHFGFIYVSLSEDDCERLFSKEFPKIKKIEFRGGIEEGIPNICRYENLKNNLGILKLYADGIDEKIYTKFILRCIKNFENLKKLYSNFGTNDIGVLEKLAESDRATRVLKSITIGVGLVLTEENCDLLRKFCSLDALRICSKIEPVVFVKIIGFEKLQQILKEIALSQVVSCPKTKMGNEFKKFKKLKIICIRGIRDTCDVNEGAELVCEICENVPNLKKIKFNDSWLPEYGSGPIKERLEPIKLLSPQNKRLFILEKEGEIRRIEFELID